MNGKYSIFQKISDFFYHKTVNSLYYKELQKIFLYEYLDV